MINARIFLDDALLATRYLHHAWRVGDTVRVNENDCACVTEWVWCLDEDHAEPLGTHRANVRLESHSVPEGDKPGQGAERFAATYAQGNVMSWGRLLRRHEVEHRTGKSRAAMYKSIAAGEFPRPVVLGSNSVAWLEREIDDWVAGLVAQRDRGEQA